MQMAMEIVSLQLAAIILILRKQFLMTLDIPGIVRSDTRSAEAFHRKGVVQTEIIRGNIPVSNGVVHLIKKPLVVIDSNLYKTLEVGAITSLLSDLIIFQSCTFVRASKFNYDVYIYVLGINYVCT